MVDVQRGTLVSTPIFVTPEPMVAGKQLTLGEQEAHHIRVRRLDVGTPVGLLDGQGSRGSGILVRLAKRSATVEVHEVHAEPPRRPVHLLLPIADKERMLWLAEKTTELGAASWRPVKYRRSHSVASRGEGTMFTQKVAARMASALEQSNNAWLPSIFPDATLERAIAAAPQGVRMILDASGTPLARVAALVEQPVVHPDAGEQMAPIVIAVGPEGGIEQDELDRLVEAGFVPVSIGATMLRFETAAISALGIVQSLIGAESCGDASRDRSDRS